MDSVTMDAGSPFIREVTIYTDATQTTPQDLTGATVTFKLLDAPNGTLVADGSTLIDEDPTTGKVIASLAAETTEDMDDTTHVLYGEVIYNNYVVDEFKLTVQ